MPRLSQPCFKAATDYIELRYNHWPPAERLARRNATVRALKKLGAAEQAEYAEKARQYVNSNTQVLHDLEDANERAEQNAQARGLLEIPRDRLNAAITRNRGNVAAAMAELNADSS